MFLDAAATLARFMVPDAAPNPELFTERRRRGRAGCPFPGGAHRSSRLWRDGWPALEGPGSRAQAVQLEELWNEMLRESDVSLFCAYPIDIFSSEFQTAKVDALLCSHTHLLPLDTALEGALNRAMDEVLGAGWTVCGG